MVDVHHTADVEVPIEFAFDYVADLRNLGEWMYGIQRVIVVGEIDRGLGAAIDGTIRVGATLRSRIEVTGFDPYASITTESRKGFVNRATWRFTALAPTATRMAVDVAYELSGGLAGKALGKAIEPFVSIAIQRSDAQLRTRLVALHQTHRCQAQ